VRTKDSHATYSRSDGRGLSGLELVGEGLEFKVFRSIDTAGEPVVLRVPVGPRFVSNANDPVVDTRELLRWEYSFARHLESLGFPVAGARELLLAEPDVLISRYVPDDGQGAEQVRLGGLLRLLHGLPPPSLPPPAAQRSAIAAFIAQRITRRWGELAAVIEDLPGCVPEVRMAAVLAARPSGSLLHLDVRAPNLRCAGGAVLAFLDWSNALIGDPEMELGRLTEFAQLAGNGIDISAVFAGYGVPADTSSPAFLIYRLDAAVMLAAVFIFEAPDEALGALAVDSMLSIRHELMAMS